MVGDIEVTVKVKSRFLRHKAAGNYRLKRTVAGALESGRMTIDPSTLHSIAAASPEGMTTIRGRRWAQARRHARVLSDDRERPAADVVVSAGPDGPTVTTSYDLSRDSLPTLHTSRSKHDGLAQWRT
jgi:hypothetical protein